MQIGMFKSWMSEAKTIQARHLEHLEETAVLKQREVGKQQRRIGKSGRMNTTNWEVEHLRRSQHSNEELDLTGEGDSYEKLRNKRTCHQCLGENLKKEKVLE